jgi:Zn-dependent protease with chaperone function
MQIACPSCGVFTEIEKAFCVRCGERVVPLTRYDLEVSDFIYPPDRDAMESLRSLEALSPILDELVVKRHVQSFLSRLRRSSRRIDFSSELGSVVRGCGIVLGLPRLPEAYLLESSAPATFTFGAGDKQFLVISSGLFEILDHGEVKAAIGHECGHMKCHHVKYHTLAEMLVRGAEFSLELAGGLLNLISPILRLMLLSWHRESEISADRAALMVSGDPAKPISLLRKLAKSLPTLENQALEPISTHPTHEERINRILEFYRSPEYKTVRKKVEQRLLVSKAISPFCRFCGSSKPVASLFCPRCGKSQV